MGGVASGVPNGWRYEGPAELLRQPRALALNSAQSKTPVGDDTWVQATVAAVADAARQGYTVIVSEDPMPWGLALHCALEAGASVLLIAPGRSREALATEYGCPAGRIGALRPVTRPVSTKQGWRLRDSAAWELADVVIPVSLRPASRWMPLLVGAASAGKWLDQRFAVPYVPGCWDSAPVAMPEPPAGGARSWLTHWTRRCHGAWPGETARDFFAAVLASGDAYPRSAPATLRRILAEQLLRPSAFRSAGGHAVVSFTAADPCTIHRSFRWCARKVAPMWEPYGIAISRAVAWERGIRPVTYGHDPAVPAWLRHGGGPFTGEAEWRALGPLDLSMLPQGSWCAVVPTRGATAAVTAQFAVPAVPWAEFACGTIQGAVAGAGPVSAADRETIEAALAP